ncbi:NitT/TauT family transport system ATP-binding protein/sulfonate transport system ATP-binding protein [Keratinibaculum paraultunense]|uniref:ABC-type quaternary amine transporter n=1 Tax=Keratinibaculum paraultunense TaxID=1278232 RepID=A0A4R3L0J6_9FIRM|nr:ABC transporter ATP-binding protein [Keratinibaculum paraultunense]QQY80100.1 ABC transporter ATP-binding protein [Keratinibaculum paraultunense]TCS91578.1 NitT/TauT family transport system ATP-binding protein/sulfonate transport system ATP-binding protein [Keratinibaculum paraultunense]
MNSIIKIQNLSKRFNSKENITVDALKNINLDVEENDFICIVGPSGCGKSTLLRIIAGLEDATEGKINYKGKELLEPTSEIGMVFQNYSLLPWRTVIDNISLGLEFKREDKRTRLEVASKYLELINMQKFANAYPYELSGGMQQRVAIARALANDPQVLLMDEPFGALDAHTRIILQKELLRIWEQNKKTVLFVTHSVDEAVYLSDKIVIMSSNPGEIKEIVNIDMERPRDRGDIEYATITSRILKMLESN